MAKTSSAGLSEMHRILRRNARDFMMYAFIEGMRCRDAAVSVEMCVIAFCERFGIDNLDPETGRSMYYTMIHEYRKDAETMKHQLNNT